MEKKMLVLLSIILFHVNLVTGEFIHLQDSLLELHSINRKQLDINHVKLLLGNEDMGGLVNHNGLGFENLWLSDYWENTINRASLTGPVLKSHVLEKEKPLSYSQKLNLKTGVVTTTWNGKNDSYKSEIFFSKSNKELLIFRIKNLTSNNLEFNLQLPVYGFPTKEEVFTTKTVNDQIIVASNPNNSFTRVFWATRSNIPLKSNDLPGNYKINIKGNEELEFVFSVATHWDGEDFANIALNSLYGFDDYILERKAHEMVWKDEWRKTPVISIPDKKYEQLYYRSIFWTFCSGASEHFLPGEAQFSDDCWGMRPYTYGAAGWTVRALVLLGHEEKAKHMAREHFKPLALKNNSYKHLSYIQNDQYDKFWQFPEMPKQDVDYYMHEGIDSLLIPALNMKSLSFAHQLSIFNDCRIRRAHQRALNGFAGAFYHQVSEYYPDPVFTLKYTYPVLRGTAILWQELVEWNDSVNGYILPKLHSSSENISKKSVLDAVIAAKWNLTMVARYANDLKMDIEKSQEWEEIADNLYIPQNDTIYLEYLNDDNQRKGSGYFGIRAPMYLGFPGLELISSLDKEKALKTLDQTWIRNNKGEGMIAFVANWFALSEAFLGRGNRCLEILYRNIECLDETYVALHEFDNNKPYFQTSYASYISTVLSMLVQSYNNTVKVFPAVPDSWENIIFYNIPTESDYKVNGIIENGEIKSVAFHKDNQLIHEQTDDETFSIPVIE